MSKAKEAQLEPQAQQVLQRIVPGKPLVQSIGRMEKDGVIFTRSMDQLRRHQDHFVVYDDGEGEAHGVIRDILVVHGHDGPVQPIYLVVLTPFVDSDDTALISEAENTAPHVCPVAVQR